jgi:DNA-binding CsgD family transcriptional regulator/tetratricopeptide (TPR) repeat protein
MGASIDLLERDDQLKQLDQAFSHAGAGHGRIAALCGEAGAGKTALVEHFVKRHASTATIHWGACENLSTPEVLLPLRDIARAAGEKIEMGADHLRQFEWLLGLLANAAGPSILIIEDLHWGDTATLDLLRYLARRIGRVRALLLITYRDEEMGSHSPIRNLLGEATPGSVDRIALQPLSLAAVTSLAAGASRSGRDVYALTAGNPFLVTETIAAGETVPSEAVRDATLARFSRLSAQARRLLEAVSIFPRRAETATVSDLVAGELDAALDECIDRGMLTLDGAIVRFRHELARRAVEDSISPGLRRELHRKVINELRRRPDSRASEVAHHAERAADVAALLEYSRLAADQAARAGAPREAAAHYAAMLNHRQTLDAALLMKTLEGHAEQSYLMGDSATAVTSMSEAAQMRRGVNDAIGLGRNLTRLTRFAWMSGRRPDAERYIQEAIDVLKEQAPGAELAWAYSHQSQLDMLAFRMDTAIEWGEQAIAIARKLDEQEIIVHALGNIGSARAELPEGRNCEELNRAYDLAVEGHYHDHVERAACNLTCIYYWRRDYDLSLHHIERGVAYARERELMHWEGYLRGFRALIQLDRGNWAAAEEEAEEISSRHSISEVYRFPAMIALTRLRCRRGDADVETPLAIVRRVTNTLDELQRAIYVAVAQAEILWASGDTSLPLGADPNPERAATVSLLRQMRDRAVDRDAQWVADLAVFWLHVLGESETRLNTVSAPYRDYCEGRWQAAADGWRALGHPFETALALSRGDDHAQRAALEIFDRLGAVPAAARLRRQMRATGRRAIPRGPIAETRANVAGLTRRQAHVLELIGEGMTNAEIAERLCISGKTAEHHVSAVMARFAVNSRRDAVAAARKAGLLDGKR